MCVRSYPWPFAHTDLTVRPRVCVQEEAMAAIEIEKQQIKEKAPKAPILPHMLRMKSKVLRKFKLPHLGKAKRSKQKKAKAMAKRPRGRHETLSRMSWATRS